MTARTVDIIVCTFRRAALRTALDSLMAQKVSADVRLRVIVVDNDTVPSARKIAVAAAKAAPFRICYIHAPAGNISLARNAGLEAAVGDWIAFLDDDEVAPPDWVARLTEAAQAARADAVFGPAVAVYPEDAPGWIQAGDYHSNTPVAIDGAVKTGHTCNALLRWEGSEWQGCRFALSRGRSGGEDTAFFYEVAGLGACLAAAPDAPVFEPVAPQRLTLHWLLRRRFRMGQSHVSGAVGPFARLELMLLALAKSGFCAAMMGAYAMDGPRWRFWLLRGALHCGVVAGCFGLPERAHYGV